MNEVKDKIALMVQEAVKSRMQGVELEWPEHSVRFFGRVAAGKSKVEVRDQFQYETTIFIRTPAGPRYFSVKVAETY